MRDAIVDSTPADPGARSAYLTYEPYYGLKEKAFSLSADPRFLYQSSAHAPTFDELRAGDSVTVRISESVVVALRPGARTTVVEDQTAAAKKSAEGADVLQQLKATVTVESVDVATGMITYKGADNRSVMRVVSDRGLIDGLKRGDIIEITYTRARAIELTKNP